MKQKFCKIHKCKKRIILFGLTGAQSCDKCVDKWLAREKENGR